MLILYTSGISFIWSSRYRITVMHPQIQLVFFIAGKILDCVWVWCCWIFLSELQGPCLHKHHFHTDRTRPFNSEVLWHIWNLKCYHSPLSLSAVSIFTGLLCASWVFTIEYSALIIQPFLLYHSLLSSLYLSPQSLLLNSQQQIVGECKPLFVEKLSITQAKFV